MSGEVLFPKKGLAEGEVLMAELADQRSMHLIYRQECHNLLEQANKERYGNFPAVKGVGRE